MNDAIYFIGDGSAEQRARYDGQKAIILSICCQETKALTRYKIDSTDGLAWLWALLTSDQLVIQGL